MAFDGILNTFKKYFKRDEIHNDSEVFDLVSKVSVGIMFAVAVLAGTSGLVGKTIDCKMIDKNPAISNSMFKQHCWLHGTYHRSFEDTEVAEGRICQSIDYVSIHLYLKTAYKCY